jgi:hypothetical protein
MITVAEEVLSEIITVDKFPPVFEHNSKGKASLCASVSETHAESRFRKPIHFVKKGWGSELWPGNGELYCGKILCFDQGEKCSLHYHKLKTETFYLPAGLS